MDSVHATTDKPVKGILKKKGSEKRPSSGVRPSWDEMNILATYHPADKDYGHMKIDEPPTPFERSVASDEEEGISAKELAKKLNEDDAAPKFLRTPSESSEDDLDDTGPDKGQRKVFEDKRKAHYNEFIMMKRAREMMDEDEEEAKKDTRKAEVKPEVRAEVDENEDDEGVEDDDENLTA